MGDSQNHGPLLGPLNTRCRITLRTQKGTIILTTTHMTGGLGYIRGSQDHKTSGSYRPWVSGSPLVLGLRISSSSCRILMFHTQYHISIYHAVPYHITIHPTINYTPMLDGSLYVSCFKRAGTWGPGGSLGGRGFRRNP